MEKDKVICEECAWKGTTNEILTAPSPFADDILNGCPNCSSVDTIMAACDEKGCWRTTSCGTPTENGYRRTCGEHAPWKKNK